MSVRSFNPALQAHFKDFPRAHYQYGFRNVITRSACQQILDKLRLKEKYPNSEGRLDIIDIFSGHGLLSTMINYELKPKNHLVIDHSKEPCQVWQDRIEYLKKHTQNRENFIFSPLSGYFWSTYDKLITEDKIVSPSFQPRSKIHDELLIVGNLTSSKYGELLLAQWLMCVGFQNWLQKYGRVRMVITAPEETATKFLAGPLYKKRNRTAMKRAVLTDAHLIAVTKPQTVRSAGFGYDPRLLIKDQPALLPSSAVAPSTSRLAVLEFVPKDIDYIDTQELSYVTQALALRLNTLVLETLSLMAPGAATDLAPLIPKETLKKNFREITDDEIMMIYNAYHNWAFKPKFEETLVTELDEPEH